MGKQVKALETLIRKVVREEIKIGVTKAIQEAINPKVNHKKVMKQGMKNVAAGANPIAIKRGIEKGAQFSIDNNNRPARIKGDLALGANSIWVISQDNTTYVEG